MQVPPATHLAWSDLVSGKAKVQPSFLAARLLIVRANMALLQASGDAASLRKFAAELRELFAQNPDSPAVQKDLAKIFG